MAELKLTVELSGEDRALLNEILTELRAARPNCERCVTQMSNSFVKCTAAISGQKPAEEPAPAPADEHPVDASTAPWETVETTVPLDEAKTEKSYTLDDVRAAVMKASRISPEMKEKVKALLNRYAKTVPTLPSDKYAEFLAGLAELGVA